MTQKIKRQFNKHSVRDEVGLPSRNDKPYKIIQTGNLALSSAGGLLFMADAVLGCFVTISMLGLSSGVERFTYKDEDNRLLQGATWTTDDGQTFSGTVKQKHAYRLAQDEIYRLNSLRTYENAAKVDKLLKKIDKDAKTLLGDLAKHVTFLETKPSQPPKPKRRKGKPLKI